MTLNRKAFYLFIIEQYAFMWYAQEGFCHCAKEDGCDVVKFKRVVTVKKKDAEALKHGLAKFGPASIAISASRKTLKFYNSGIYDDEDCSE